MNSASAQVLAAMISGAYSDSTDSNSALSSSQALSVAAQLRAYLALVTTRPPTASNVGNAAYDPSDIARLTAGITSNGSNSTIPTPTTGNKLPGGLKRAQEVVARAFSDSWNTRTWNLMIDIVAQTGRFPTNRG